MALDLPLVNPYLDKSADFSGGVNFAVAGATAIEHDFFAKNNLSVDITPQYIMMELGWMYTYFFYNLSVHIFFTMHHGFLFLL